MRMHMLRLAVTATLLAAGGAFAEPVLVKIPAKGPIVFEQLQARGFEIQAVTSERMIELIVDEDRLAELRALGYPVTATKLGPERRLPWIGGVL